MNEIICPRCGVRIALPADFGRAKIRCDSCGVYADVPPELRNRRGSQAELPAPVSVDQLEEPSPFATQGRGAPGWKPPPPPSHKVEYQPAPMVAGSDDEDDNLPYTVPGDPTRPCPECEGAMALDAVLCHYCGHDLLTGLRAVRRYEPLVKEWDTGLSLQNRVAVFAIAATAGLFMLILGFVAVGRETSAKAGLLSFIYFLFCQAFLLGTFDRLRVTRSSQGRSRITKRWRFCFVPFAPVKVPWRGQISFAVAPSNAPGIAEWWIFLALLPFFIVPAILWWWFIIHADRYDVVILNAHQSMDRVVFRCRDMAKANEVGLILAEATGLGFNPVLSSK